MSHTTKSKSSKKSQLAFTYSGSQALVTWGHHFDSLTEIKFAISVAEENSFLRSPISLYFDPGSLRIAHFPGLFHRFYTPDFLIRNYQTRQATVVEIMPTGYTNWRQLEQH